MSRLGEQAGWYRSQGFHPIPCVGKVAQVPWKDYQTAPPDPDQIDVWWEKMPDANIALVLGRGMLVVDLDGPDAEKALNEYGIQLPVAAPRVQTGRDGFGQHVYLAAPCEIGNATAILRKGDSAVDVKADGGYVLAPPSIHPETGREYKWLSYPTLPLPEAPPKLIELLTTARKSNDEHHGGVKENWVATALQGVSEGARNVTAAKLAGYLLRHLPRDIATSTLALFGQRCKPPMPLSEIRKVVDSVASKYGAEYHDEPETRSGPEALAVEHIATVMDRVREEHKRGVQDKVGTPFPSLDRCTVGGFGPGELVMLGARPGVGKTAIALEIARHAAECGRRTLIISREMLNSALGRRILSQSAHIRSEELQRGETSPDVLDAAIGQVAGLPLWFCDKASTVDHIEAAIQACPEGIDFLVVDYLQLVFGPLHIREVRHIVDHVALRLKTIAQQREIPVLALSSVRRDAEGRAPQMSDLKESSGLEHTAHTIIFLHRPNDDDPSCVELAVLKSREGPIGKFKLHFAAEYVSFLGERERGWAGDAQDDGREAEVW